MLLPPATKLGQGYVFTGVCDSVYRGGTWPGTLPGTRYTPRTRYPPPDQAHPPDQVHPPRLIQIFLIQFFLIQIFLIQIF